MSLQQDEHRLFQTNTNSLVCSLQHDTCRLMRSDIMSPWLHVFHLCCWDEICPLAPYGHLWPPSPPPIKNFVSSFLWIQLTCAGPKKKNLNEHKREKIHSSFWAVVCVVDPSWIYSADSREWDSGQEKMKFDERLGKRTLLMRTTKAWSLFHILCPFYFTSWLHFLKSEKKWKHLLGENKI